MRKYYASPLNVMGTANVLEAARERNLERVVLASSTLAGLSVVENFKGERFPEDFSMRVVSEHPRSLYVATKISAEHLCLYYRDAYGVDVAVVRYSAVIGHWPGAPRSLTAQILSAFLDPAMQGKRAIIDDPQLVWSGSQEYVDVRDAARGTVAALNAPAVPSAVYNISLGVKHIFKGLTLNLSKSGSSWTVGRPGASVNFRGDKVSGNVGIPGSGIFRAHRSEPFSNSPPPDQITSRTCCL